MAEYNPFHNGHKYHIETAKKELGADYVVAVMSGNFVMRGEPALFGKFERAKMASVNGVDLVIELPLPYALASAEYFAYGAVSILNSLNIIDFISFGSECGDIKELKDIADIMSQKDFVEKIKDASKKGVPVFEACSEQFCDEKRKILKTPNNMLGINYIKALNKLNSSITAHTLTRIKTDYNDITSNGNFASATAMRELAKEGKDLSCYMPDTAYEIIKDKECVFEENFTQSILYSLRIKGKNEYLKYADTGEGLHNLIKKASFEKNIEDVISVIKSKRYSYTRIKRILYNIFLDIPKEMRNIPPQYARVLAFNEKGKELISILKKKSNIPVFTNLKKEMLEDEMLKLDLKAGRIYSLAYEDYEEKILIR